MLSLVNKDSTKHLNKSDITALKLVTLIWNEKNLISTLNSIMNQSGEITVLNLSGDILPASNNHSFQLLEASDFVDNDSVAFLKDYRDLMGRLSAHMNSSLWWATNIASKNRFTSNIPSLLNQIEISAKAIALDSANLIIYKPDLSITSSLVNLCDQVGVKLSYAKWHVRYCLFFERFRAFANHLKSCLHLMYRLAVVRLFYKPRQDSVLDTNVVALKSFFYESSVVRKNGYRYKDPMFGRLPDFLADRSKLLILTNILGRYRLCIKKINQHKKFNIVPVEYWLSIKSIIGSLLKILSSSLDRKVTNSLDFRGINVRGIFREELYRKYNDIPLEHQVFYPLMKACFKAIKIKQYIQTYENNPWEKMALTAIQEVSSITRTIGFQHAVVPQASVNMFSSSEEQAKMPQPDKILCVGREPLNIINTHSETPLTNAEISCGLRYEYLQQIDAKPRSKIQKILVAPEGVPDVVPMLKYIISQLKYRKEYQLTFRFHPALSYKIVSAKYGFELENTANTALSQASLQEDLQNNDLCIYWGSTVSLEALSMGVPLIHYDLQSMFSYDPLFSCKHLKWIVTQDDSLPDIIKTINDLPNKEFARQVHLAKEYMKGYFYPVTDESLGKFFDA